MIEMLAKASRRSFDRVARDLADALAAVAGEGAVATFDGERFALGRDDRALDVDGWLDAAVDRLA